MNTHDCYQEFWDHLERAPLGPDEVYEAAESHSLTELDYDPLCRLPIELANQLIVQYCLHAPTPVRAGDMFRALSLEAEELLFHRVPPAELFYSVL